MDKLSELIEKHRGESGSVIGLLQDLMQAEGHLPEDALTRISEELDVPLSRLYGLVTFYTSLRLDPTGKHHVCVCVGTACHVNGADKIVESLERELQVTAGDTTDDGQFTLETVNCVGACALGPLAVVNGEYHSRMDQKKAEKLVAQCRET
ncbi:MAG: NAD(P)H-dependent oxidoreductase subunit E [Lentisphaerae bacterium]|jgi:NADH:ubiquinone oxidoreductase subunit E|nr:NAD(P)H-dependent oxidoreductase subunit E [Lentisphaerota bacterium]MBT4814774.1 NAD(P)H-dependent oxidoreductase subunit E [Lentisphaerota bacterium]MBT5606368.1 NAD(P)H-dependent oxidoreductase subunit E [Lentisphaerota bacterium]MBT7056777.1 NAD(P)H-dependent oxidoreductase subunit E [Lentisphaerota bacterium]MBT7840382.1 NAD(P)H-dependent oxidoreductase subunit E [Lentisphaerota bacterium]